MIFWFLKTTFHSVNATVMRWGGYRFMCGGTIYFLQPFDNIVANDVPVNVLSHASFVWDKAKNLFLLGTAMRFPFACPVIKKFPNWKLCIAASLCCLRTSSLHNIRHFIFLLILLPSSIWFCVHSATFASSSARISKKKSSKIYRKSKLLEIRRKTMERQRRKKSKWIFNINEFPWEASTCHCLPYHRTHYFVIFLILSKKSENGWRNVESRWQIFFSTKHHIS